jgi:hypothetical protein
VVRSGLRTPILWCSHRFLYGAAGCSSACRGGIGSIASCEISTTPTVRASGQVLGSLFLMALGSSVGYPGCGFVLAVLGAPVFSFIAMFRFGRHIRRAQQRAGQCAMVLPPWILALALLIAPVSFAYVQKELNTCPSGTQATLPHRWRRPFAECSKFAANAQHARSKVSKWRSALEADQARCSTT